MKQSTSQNNININNINLEEVDVYEHYFQLCIEDRVTCLFSDTMLNLKYWKAHKGQICYICRKKGHLAKDCKKICKKCGNLHEAPVCAFYVSQLFEKIIKLLKNKKKMSSVYKKMIKNEKEIINKIYEVKVKTDEEERRRLTNTLAVSPITSFNLPSSGLNVAKFKGLFIGGKERYKCIQNGAVEIKPSWTNVLSFGYLDTPQKPSQVVNVRISYENMGYNRGLWEKDVPGMYIKKLVKSYEITDKKYLDVVKNRKIEATKEAEKQAQKLKEVKDGKKVLNKKLKYLNERASKLLRKLINKDLNEKEIQLLQKKFEHKLGEVERCEKRILELKMMVTNMKNEYKNVKNKCSKYTKDTKAYCKRLIYSACKKGEERKFKYAHLNEVLKNIYGPAIFKDQRAKDSASKMFCEEMGYGDDYMRSFVEDHGGINSGDEEEAQEYERKNQERRQHRGSVKFRPQERDPDAPEDYDWEQEAEVNNSEEEVINEEEDNDFPEE